MVSSDNNARLVSSADGVGDGKDPFSVGGDDENEDGDGDGKDPFSVGGDDENEDGDGDGKDPFSVGGDDEDGDGDGKDPPTVGWDDGDEVNWGNVGIGVTGKVVTVVVSKPSTLVVFAGIVTKATSFE